MRKQNLSQTKKFNAAEATRVFYGFFLLHRFPHTFLHLSLPGFSFDWLYALKPKNPE
ncbi:hypothetical protein ACFSOV_17535 [Pedobacter petrophilus]|uniref:hypothetical protein n=1 Tax=Pedobacter petrophilus TaxID=1908241 RepID=UPI00142EF271|nr:hypothetical protein [Pedobacter petrophilus]